MYIYIYVDYSLIVKQTDNKFIEYIFIYEEMCTEKNKSSILIRGREKEGAFWICFES